MKLTLLTGKKNLNKISLKSFTLLEVLTSLVILLSGIIFIFEYLFGSAAALNHINNRIEANFLLDQKRWEIKEKISEDSYLISYQDEVNLNNAFFVSRVSLGKVNDLDNLYKLVMEVSWEERGRGRSLWSHELIKKE